MNDDMPNWALMMPHRPPMCLIDHVDQWTDSTIQCSTSRHQQHDHPLRTSDGLHAAHTVEYAAQAIAIHAGLLQVREGASARSGLLVALRRLQIASVWLDRLATPLVIRAERLAMTDQALYQTEVTAGDRLLMTGQLLVVLSTEPTAGESD